MRKATKHDHKVGRTCTVTVRETRIPCPFNLPALSVLDWQKRLFSGTRNNTGRITEILAIEFNELDC